MPAVGRERAGPLHLNASTPAESGEYDAGVFVLRGLCSCGLLTCSRLQDGGGLEVPCERYLF
jgi:hypothetical protein